MKKLKKILIIAALFFFSFTHFLANKDSASGCDHQLHFLLFRVQPFEYARCLFLKHE